MQLDNTRIAIRERDLADVLDLSLQVIRAYALPWFLASLAGAVPLAVLNWWLLKSKWLLDTPENKALYLGWMVVLVAFELPLASAGLTRFIGHAVFVDRPPVRQIVRDLMDSLYRGYPSGATLPWETDEDVPQRTFAVQQVANPYQSAS